MRHSFISIKEFSKEPYSNILGYPKCSKRQLQSRISELEKLNVKSIAFTGPTTIGKLEILGKGYVGLVVLAKKGNKKVALKIRRLDSPRSELKSEAKFLGLVNSVSVGPKLFDFSKNFVIMEYLEGQKIDEWVNTLKGQGSSKKAKIFIKQILEDCFRMDQIGFDHGELSSISKHVIVGDKKPTLIDFESSSTNRNPSNVTSITQAIFIGSGLEKKIKKIYKVPVKEKIIESLRIYKKEKTRKNFDNLLQVLKL